LALYNIGYTGRFKRDLKRFQNAEKKINKFKEVTVKLVNGYKLEKKFKDHKLMGI
jgi:addiction module RelE/StbE family toxin